MASNDQNSFNRTQIEKNHEGTRRLSECQGVKNHPVDGCFVMAQQEERENLLHPRFFDQRSGSLAYLIRTFRSNFSASAWLRFRGDLANENEKRVYSPCQKKERPDNIC